MGHCEHLTRVGGQCYICDLEARGVLLLDACERALRLMENDAGSDGMAQQVIAQVVSDARSSRS